MGKINNEDICHMRSLILDGILDSILGDVCGDDDCDLYHYTSPNGLMGIVENSEIWFGNILDLNDITEIDYAYTEVICPILKECKVISEKSRDALLNRLPTVYERKLYLPKNEGVDLYNTNIFILSTSLNGNAHSLWSNYTKTSSKAGYAISLKIKDWYDAFLDEIEKRDKSSNKEIESILLSGKVVYKPCEQKKLVEKFLSPIEEKIEGYSEEYKNILYDIVAQGLLILALFMKDSDFTQEDEYRFVTIIADELASVSNKETPHIKFVNVDGSIVSRLVMPFDIGKIRKITVSPYMVEQAHVENDLRFFLSKYGVTDLDIIVNVKRKLR